MELAYTSIPLLIVLGLFAVTFVSRATAIDDDRRRSRPRRRGHRLPVAVAVRLPRRSASRVTGTGRRSPSSCCRPTSTVRFDLTSLDVIHSFWIPGFRFKRDMFPGQAHVVPGRRRATAPGVLPEHRRVRRVLRARPPYDALLGADRDRRDEFDAVAAGRGTPAGSDDDVIDDRRRTSRRSLSVDEFIDARPRTSTRGLPRTLVGWLTTTDHKAIGVAYAVTSLVFLAIGGALAGIIRAELAEPGHADRRRADVQQRVHDPRQRDGVPVRRPVRVRARQLPRAAADRRARPGVPAPQRALVLAVPVRRHRSCCSGSSPTAARPRSAGSPTRRCRAPPARRGSAPTCGSSSVILTGTSGTLDRGQHHHHRHHDARPGHDACSACRSSRGTCSLTSFMVLLAFPVLTGALMMLLRRPAVRHPLLRPDRRRVADPVAAPVLVLRPPRGVHRRPAVLRRGHRDLPGVLAHGRCSATRASILATLAIARAVDVGVGPPHVRHRSVVLPFFAATSLLIAVPTGVKVFNWIGTMWGGSLTFEPPMLFALGFLVTFVDRRAHRRDAGLADARLPPLRHVLRRRPLPLRDGRHRRLRAVRGDLLLVAEGDRADAVGTARHDGTSGCCSSGSTCTFFVMHLLGRGGMPRRVADYRADSTASSV